MTDDELRFLGPRQSYPSMDARERQGWERQMRERQFISDAKLEKKLER
jgi:hypothetical protein